VHKVIRVSIQKFESPTLHLFEQLRADHYFSELSRPTAASLACLLVDPNSLLALSKYIHHSFNKTKRKSLVQWSGDITYRMLSICRSTALLLAPRNALRSLPTRLKVFVNHPFHRRPFTQTLLEDFHPWQELHPHHKYDHFAGRRICESKGQYRCR
jgi:hypothetical protein